jgi:flagellin
MSAQALGLQDSKGNSTLDLSSSKGIADALSVVDTALQSSLSQQTKLGATQEGLDFSASNYTTQAASVTDAASTTGDSDMAKQITNMKSSQTQQTIALHLMTLSNHRNTDVLALLG